ncbi:MAG: ABC transporter transmembrane domain-containing protein, partial [Huintestinicola sp.]
MTEKNMTGRSSSVMKWLFERTAGMRGGMLLLCIWSLLYAVIGVSFALICRGIVDSASARDADGIRLFSLLLAGAVLVQFALRIAVGITEERLRARLEKNMRGEMLGELMNKEFSAVSGYHSGELLNKLFSDISVAADGLTALLPLILNSSARIICAAVLLIMLDSRFAAVYITGGLAVFGVTAAFRGKMKRLHTDVQEKEDAMRSIMQETVENLLVLKVFGAEEKMLSRVDEKQDAHYRSRLKRRAVSVAAGSGLDLAFRMGYILALIMGAVWIFKASMTYGTLTAVLQLVNQLQSPFAGLSSVLQRYYGMIASGERIRAMYELPDEKPAEKKLDYDELEKIMLEDVCFSYGENDVLKDVCIDIEKGSITSLTGI